ncbi:MAG: DUF4145 domain-containing protein [Saprospiraceae bacterium]|nr:DUF4145 domain-containing protein [Saprospiraceae bacterium]
MERLPNKYVCLECMGLRHHYLSSPVVRSEFDEDEKFVKDKFFIACCGCDTISNVEELREDNTNDLVSWEIFPPREESIIKLKKLKNTDDKIVKHYKRTIKHFNEPEGEVDCAANLRMLIEGICSFLKIEKGVIQKNGKVINSSTLEGKILGLAQKGYLIERIAETLHQLRFLGNEALHELEPPPREELHLGIRIIENVIDSLFEISHIGKELETKRVERQATKTRKDR